MAEFVVKIADDRGRVQQHIEQGYSEAEVRDRFSQQGYLVYWVKPQGLLTSGVALRRRRKLKQAIGGRLAGDKNRPRAALGVAVGAWGTPFSGL